MNGVGALELMRDRADLAADCWAKLLEAIQSTIDIEFRYKEIGVKMDADRPVANRAIDFYMRHQWSDMCGDISDMLVAARKASEDNDYAQLISARGDFTKAHKCWLAARAEALAICEQIEDCLRQNPLTKPDAVDLK